MNYRIIETISLNELKNNIILNLKKKSTPNQFRKKKMIFNILNEKISKVKTVTGYLFLKSEFQCKNYPF